MKPNNSIIIAGDKYNDTPQINQSFNDTVGDITLREKSVLDSITANSSLYDRTLCPNQSQLNRTPESFNQTVILNNPNLESEQVQANLPNKINQITLDNSANIE